jgi:hypothetical protein
MTTDKREEREERKERGNSITIKFLGTRGRTRTRSRYHFRKVATLIIAGNERIFIGYNPNPKKYKITTILIPDAHYAGSIKHDISSCEVYSPDFGYTKNKFNIFSGKFKVGNVIITPIRVRYLPGSNTYGFKIQYMNKSIFISHELMKIPNIKHNMKDIDLFIGDASSYNKDVIMARGRKSTYGHSSMVRQQNMVNNIRTIFTNCSSDVIRNHKLYSALIESIAYDGMVTHLG